MHRYILLASSFHYYRDTWWTWWCQKGTLKTLHFFFQLFLLRVRCWQGALYILSHELSALLFCLCRSMVKELVRCVHMRFIFHIFSYESFLWKLFFSLLLETLISWNATVFIQRHKVLPFTMTCRPTRGVTRNIIAGKFHLVLQPQEPTDIALVYHEIITPCYWSHVYISMIRRLSSKAIKSNRLSA